MMRLFGHNNIGDTLGLVLTEDKFINSTKLDQMKKLTKYLQIWSVEISRATGM